MRFLDDLREKRQKLLEALEANQADIKLDIFEDFYPDKAHFIYELLQNAEDTEASEVKFSLSEDRLVFEHNGRPFNQDDVGKITGFGVGTKRDDQDKIGRFGVGFKAVFLYTATPRVWSPTFSFEISDLVMPAELDRDTSIGQCTRFEFPFNSRKIPATDAYADVRRALDEISDDTLLFLSHIESVQWQVDNGPVVSLLRVRHSEHHIETLKEADGEATQSSRYLRFTQPVPGLEKGFCAIAFNLTQLSHGDSHSDEDSFAKRFRIEPATPGRVAVYFTAAKETSGLRFHLHAPFVPELSRASVKDTPANTDLFRQLAALAAQSLAAIRDFGLLDVNFLAALPNSHDGIPERYECIHEAIVNAMNEEPLTPTHRRSYAPAKQLLQGPAELKALLIEEDIKALVEFDGVPPTWAVAATQRNSDADRFLSGLAITDWGVAQLVRVLKQRLHAGRQFDTTHSVWRNGPDPACLEWLKSKADDWHQKLYAFLHRQPKEDVRRLADLCLVRLSSGEYRTAHECFFPTDEVKEDQFLPCVAGGTYATGASKSDQESAKAFLEALGVRKIGEREQVEAILKRRYSRDSESPSRKVQMRDLKRFIAFAENHPTDASIFKDYWIFDLENGDRGQPGHVYLDVPYLDTGLHSYYRALGEKTSPRWALDRGYIERGMPSERLVGFARLTGAVDRLEIKEVGCVQNPCWKHLSSAPGSYATASGTDRDFNVPRLKELFRKPTKSLAKLLWGTLCEQTQDGWFLKACYRRNQSNDARYADSQLVHHLREGSWIPQRNGDFVRPAEASRDLLPDGFPFDAGYEWIKAVRFGENAAARIRERQRERETAQELGFVDDKALEDGRWFAGLSQDERAGIKSGHERNGVVDLPDRQPSDPTSRAERVRRIAMTAPPRTVEMRPRSVSRNREPVMTETDPYLKDLYTNSEHVMICQVCKEPLPFKLDGGSFFFEAVEFLPTLRQHHYQNYLALCPNHAAMYQLTNGSKEKMKDLFGGLNGNELEVCLASQPVSIYFNRTHIADLRVIIEVEDANDG